LETGKRLQLGTERRLPSVGGRLPREDGVAERVKVERRVVTAKEEDDARAAHLAEPCVR